MPSPHNDQNEHVTASFSISVKTILLLMEQQLASCFKKHIRDMILETGGFLKMRYAPVMLASPFFHNFNEISPAAMRAICCKVADRMYFVIDGNLDYFQSSLLHSQSKDSWLATIMRFNWVAEAALWIRWLHQGSLVAKTESALLVLEVATLHSIFRQYSESIGECYSYAKRFMNYADEQGDNFNDLSGGFDDLQEMAFGAFNSQNLEDV